MGEARRTFYLPRVASARLTGPPLFGKVSLEVDCASVHSGGRAGFRTVARQPNLVEQGQKNFTELSHYYCKLLISNPTFLASIVALALTVCPLQGLLNDRGPALSPLSGGTRQPVEPSDFLYLVV